MLSYLLMIVLLGGSYRPVFNLETRDFQNSRVTINTNQVTLEAQEDSVSFFAIGDWGGFPVKPYWTPTQLRCANLMDKLSSSLSSRFQLALGDNFYFSGVSSVTDTRFNTTFENVYNTNYLKNSPWFVILGNHDHNGKPDAQVAYSAKSKRWVMPSLNYTIDVFTSSGAKKMVSILMLDTIVLCDKKPPAWLVADVEKRLAAINASNPSYILVVGHYPVYSIAEHGPTRCLIDNLRPLLHKYGVSAYISGHDHNLQHLQNTYLGKTVDYIVSGAGSKTENSKANLKKYDQAKMIKFFWGGSGLDGGVASIKAAADKMTISFYQSNSNSDMLYQVSITPRA